MGYRVSTAELIMSLEKQNCVWCKGGTDFFSQEGAFFLDLKKNIYIFRISPGLPNVTDCDYNIIQYKVIVYNTIYNV